MIRALNLFLLLWSCLAPAHAAVTQFPAACQRADSAVFISPNPSENQGIFGLRYLNPDSGRFWTRDTFEGKQCDPISLHKYLYAHASPVNHIDPSGQATLGETMQSINIGIRQQVRRAVVNVRRWWRVARCGIIHIEYKAAERAAQAYPRCYGTPHVLSTSASSTLVAEKTAFLTAALAGRTLYMRLRCDTYWKGFAGFGNPFKDSVAGHRQAIQQLTTQISRCGIDALLLAAVGR